jgi:hypothetical protein
MPTLAVGMMMRLGAMPTLAVGMMMRQTCLLSRCARLASMAPINCHPSEIEHRSFTRRPLAGRTGRLHRRRAKLEVRIAHVDRRRAGIAGQRE